jgi:hypothetical protein
MTKKSFRGFELVTALLRRLSRVWTFVDFSLVPKVSTPIGHHSYGLDLSMKDACAKRQYPFRRRRL